MEAEPPEQLVDGNEPAADEVVYEVRQAKPVITAGVSPFTKPETLEVINGTGSPEMTDGDEAKTIAATFATSIVKPPDPDKLLYVTRSMGTKLAVKRTAESAESGVQSHVAERATEAILLQPSITLSPERKVTDPAVLTCAVMRIVVA